MSDRKIEVKYKSEAKDYWRVLFWHQRTRLIAVAVVYIFVAVPIVFFIEYLESGISNKVGEKGLSTVFGLFLFLPILLGVSTYFELWRRAKKTAAITEPAIAVFTDAGLSTKTLSSASEMVWSRFNKVYVTKADIIFLPYENVFYSIPKRFFVNETELAEAISILRESLGIKLKIKR